MEINAIYTRSVIQTMAGKAIRDLRGGGERELRNVIELCKGRSTLQSYRRFWSVLEDLLRLPGQRYGALLSRAANDVDINCLRTLIANLGLHAYANGGDTLRDSWSTGRAPVYWMELLDGTAAPDALHRTILELQQQGTSSFLLRVGREAELGAALHLAGQHRQSVFVLACRGIACCRAYLEDMAALGNVVLLVGYGDIPTLAHQLKHAGILFGFYRNYAEIESLEAEEELLQRCMAAGCFIGVYEGNGRDLRENQDLLYYAKLRELRRKGTKEIVLCDLWRDREVVQRLLLHQQPLPNGMK